MGSYTPCAGTRKPALNIHRTSWDLGTKFGGKLTGDCPECGRGLKPTKDGGVPAHKPRVTGDGACELRYRGCQGIGSLHEDPYAADVDNTPGVMIMVCEHCLQERRDDI